MKREFNQQVEARGVKELGSLKGVEALSVQELQEIEVVVLQTGVRDIFDQRFFTIRDQITGEKITDAYGVSVTL